MRQKSDPDKASAEQVMKDIRRGNDDGSFIRCRYPAQSPKTTWQGRSIATMLRQLKKVVFALASRRYLQPPSKLVRLKDFRRSVVLFML